MVGEKTRYRDFCLCSPVAASRKDKNPSKNRKERTIRRALSQACGVAIRPSRDSFIGHKGRKTRDKKKKYR